MFSAGISDAVRAFKTSGSGMAQAIQNLGASATTAQVPLEEQLSVLGTLELWEYIPQTITAKSGSSSGSGKSGGGAASNLKADYKSYLSNDRGKSPARDDADTTAAMNKVTAMPY